MSKNLEKRRSFFTNTKRRFDKLGVRLEDMGPHVPETVLRDWNKISDQIKRAEESLDSPEGEYEAGRAHSLLYKFTESSAFAGLGQRYGGWKDKLRYEQRTEHLRWAEYARERLAIKKRPLKQGDKAEIIRAVAKRFGVKPNTMSRRLRDMGVWK